MKEVPEYRRFGAQLGVGAIFAAIGLAVLCWFVTFAEPPERKPRTPSRQNYSEQPLIEALTGRQNEKRLNDIVALGVRQGERQVGRRSGSPGFYRTETFIKDTFHAAGLDVKSQEMEVVVPVTEYCEILDFDGRPLEGVTLYPFAPSGITPLSLPNGEIKARLVQTDSTELRCLTGHDPAKSILLTTLDAVKGWEDLAAVGVPAVIVRDDETAKALRGDPDQAGNWKSLISMAETRYPRFFAKGPIEKYAGSDVTIRCKVAWQAKKVRNVIGVLRGDKPQQEALVLTAFYDSNSLVPDLAPGAEQAVSLAALLDYATALAQYRGQLGRDVIFVATAGHAQSLTGASRLMEAVETFSQGRSDFRSFEQRRKDHEQKLFDAKHADKLLDDVKQQDFKEKWSKEDEKFRKWFEVTLRIPLGEIQLDRQEETLQTHLAHLRGGSPVYRDGFDFQKAGDEERKAEKNSHPLLKAYLDAKRLDNRAASLTMLPLWDLAQREEFTSWNYAERSRKFFREATEYHEQQIKELDDLIAVRDLFAQYRQTLAINLELKSGGSKRLKDISVLVGFEGVGTVVEPQVTDLSNLILEKASADSGEPRFKVINWGSRDAKGSQERQNINSPWLTELESECWFKCGLLAFTICNYDFYPAKACTPEDVADGLLPDVYNEQIPVLGKALLSVAFGRVGFKPIASDRYKSVCEVHGTVYGNSGASAMTAMHPMGHNTFVRFLDENKAWTTEYDSRGIRLYPVLKTNPYGEYEKALNFDLYSWTAIGAFAARFDDYGKVIYVADTSPASQSLFHNASFWGSDVSVTSGETPKPVNIGMFRCAPVEFYSRINPKTLKPFKGVGFVSRSGLSDPARYWFGSYTAYMEPDFAFYIGLLDGAAENEEVLMNRAFMLNAKLEEPISREEPEIYGRGYLAADTPVLSFPNIDASASMLRTGEKRLALQKKYGMADEQMLSFHDSAKEWLADAMNKRAQAHTASAANAAGSSLAYAINNHPVIRSRVTQAVIGILWYLALLVPFVFFCEKLVFGFTDIRKQLLADGLIFLAIFSLLRLFHPAFQMVRSSLMILLGFIILLLTLLVTLMVGGKFKQNLKELRSKEGAVEGADVNRGGVIGTAFMLGLNNMRRRKVRTGLTCITLILITFVMICFTSVSTDLVNVEYATGRSQWNGIMMRDPNYFNLEDSQISNIRRIYGDDYPIVVTKWLATEMFRWLADRIQNAEIIIDREFEVGGTKLSKRTKFNAVLEMEWNEPAFSGIDRFLLTKRGWFPRPPTTRNEMLEASKRGYKEQNYVILPQSAAEELGLSVQDVDSGHPVVSIRGTDYEVLGIIDQVELTKCVGLDGKSILPYDLNGVQAFGEKNSLLIVPEETAHLTGSQVMIVNKMPTVKAGFDQVKTVSCSILFPKKGYKVRADEPERPAVEYKEQRRLVLQYLERIGEPAYYATDGTAYYGYRQRAKTIAGLLQLLVPILIAALTVFNTMRGSVYERKEEIYVYNAVGIAPNHVFFMFMAEACVYAVVGAMCGYVLSQATGRVLTVLNLTGGMNMDYSSIETIYASLAIVAAVMLSTIIPARDAARLASPSGVASWAVPEMRNNTMEFNLPFTFSGHDRVAVISYFNRWLDSNGAGSSGPFYCSSPEPRLERTGELVPALVSTVWLKPYDLGVSQKMKISLPTDPETGEYVAHVELVLLSGNVAAWERTVKPFLSSLRKQFLNWRATTQADRKEMFAEAKAILKKQALAEG